MKKKDIGAFLALTVAGAVTYGTWRIFPNAHWAIYIVVALLVAGLVSLKFTELFGDDDATNEAGASRDKGNKVSAAKGVVFSLETLEELLLHIDDMGGGAAASPAQRAAVERLGFGGSPKEVSSEQASAILSANAYAKAVSDKVTKDYHVGKEVSQRLIGFIVADRPVLERVIKWNERSFARGGGDKVSPKNDEFWNKVLQEGKKIASELS